MVRALKEAVSMPKRCLTAFAVAAATACALSFPQLAFATVTINDTALAQGQNSVGGGTATLTETVLDMVNVAAEKGMSIDQDLTINFNGGNDIDHVDVTGSATVTTNFSGENSVEDIKAYNSSNVTINANGHNEFDHVEANDDSNMTINVTGENNFESIVGNDDANITIKGTDCQKKDTVNIEGDDGDFAVLRVEHGNLTIDHVTVNLEGEINNDVGSYFGNVVVDTSKIEGSDGVPTQIFAGGIMQIIESVIDVTGDMWSAGMMTIKHSDVKVSESDFAAGLPYRVFSSTGIELIDEKNGEVKEGEIFDEKVWYVDTDDNDGKDVDLKADGEPAYYKCKDDSSTKGMPKTADGTSPFWPMAAGVASIAVAAFAMRRREEL